MSTSTMRINKSLSNVENTIVSTYASDIIHHYKLFLQARTNLVNAISLNETASYEGKSRNTTTKDLIELAQIFKLYTQKLRESLRKYNLSVISKGKYTISDTNQSLLNTYISNLQSFTHVLDRLILDATKFKNGKIKTPSNIKHYSKQKQNVVVLKYSIAANQSMNVDSGLKTLIKSIVPERQASKLNTEISAEGPGSLFGNTEGGRRKTHKRRHTKRRHTRRN